MKTKYRFIGLVGSLVCFGSGVTYAEGQSKANALTENLSAMTNPAPSIQGQEFRTQYTMKLAPPSPEVDYKIARTAPDPTIDYRIMTTGPHPKLFPVGIDTRQGEIPFGKK
jgi:hypothetical protein